MRFSTKLFLLLAVFISLTAGIVSYLAYSLEAANIRLQVENRYEEQAFNILDKIDRILFERSGDIKIMATEHSLTSEPLSPAHITKRLLEFKNNYKVYTYISFFTLDRRWIADTEGTAGVKRQASTEFWPDIAKGRDFAMKVAMSEKDGGKVMIHFDSVVRGSGGNAIGVIESRMPIEELNNIVEEAAGFGKNSEWPLAIDIVDGNGLTVYSSSSRNPLLKKNPYWDRPGRLFLENMKNGLVREAEDGLDVIRLEQGFKDFSGNGWILMLHVPSKITSYPISRLRRIFLTAAVLAGVFGLVVSAFFSRRILRPIKDLREMALGLGKGDFDMKVKVPLDGELGLLADSFNRMASELKERNDTLSRNEKRYRMLAETIPHGVQESDTEGVIEFANTPLHNMYGCAEGELAGRRIWDFFESEGEREGLRRYLEKVLREQPAPVSYFSRRKTKGGAIIDVRTDWDYKRDDHGTITGFVSIITDITKSKKADEELKREKAYLEKLHNSIGDIVLVVSLPERTIEFINASVEAVFGYRIDECIGRGTEFLHVDAQHYADFGKIMEDAVRSGGDGLKTEYLLRRRNGEIFPIGITTSFFRTDGAVTRLVSVIRDITEQKKAEEIRIANQNRISREMADAIPGIVYVIDEHVKLVRWNKNLELITGYSEEEIKRIRPVDLLHEDHRELGVSKLKESFSAGKAELEADFLTKDGVMVPYYFSARRFEAEGRPYLVGVGVDITERKRIEAELQRAAKLESTGILAGGIAHDFNNLLTGIVGNLSLAKALMDSPEKLLKILSNTEKASLRAAGLTQQLLTFAKGGLPVKEVSHIAELLKDTARFALSGSSVRCDFSIPDGLYAVNIDKGQVSQVVSNLTINAVQAMPEGGVISIGCENAYIDRWPTPDIAPGRFLKISIKDSGIGITKEHIKKIFDPYFTTKQTGSGLGLAISYSIIRKHGGNIVVESELGVGSTFHIYLPAFQAEVRPADETEEINDPVTRRGRILVMDDEEIVSETVREILTHFGHEVDFAKDGAEAIESYETARRLDRPYDVLIMDLTIPGGMGGKETIKRLLETDPHVRAIVSSGYSYDPIMSDFKEYGFKDVIAKPYKVHELSGKVSRLLKGTDEDMVLQRL